MSIEIASERASCFTCGIAYSRRKGYFPVSYAQQYKGLGFIPVCKVCIDNMYSKYLSQCNDSRTAVRQMCRKYDLYWSDKIYDQVESKSTARSIMTQYISKINSVSVIGKSYDDTLLSEGKMWDFSYNAVDESTIKSSSKNDDSLTIDDIPEDVIVFWGSGYTPEMYNELQQRYQYWISKYPEGTVFDIGTEAIIRQICSLELDINRDRVAGKSVDKNINALNTLLGSMNIKPIQKKQEDMDMGLSTTPLGVWLYKYENERPLPELDDSLKDASKIKKYVFTWLGHVCKMLNVKNSYSDLYEKEIERLRVEHPEYDGDDEEVFMKSLEDSSNE